MTFDLDKMYAIEGDSVQFLVRLAHRLYSDTPLAGDERRDWANDLYNVHLRRLVAFESGEEPVVQTSGPQCKKCGAFTTYKRVESHGLCMKCEQETKTK